MQLVANSSRPAELAGCATGMADLLGQFLALSNEALFAVPFVSRSGTEMLASQVADLLRRNGTFRLVSPFLPRGIDPVCLRELDQLPGPLQSNRVHICRDYFHCKVYVFDLNNGDRIACVGSSNMTGGGLRSNCEMNVVLTHVEDSTPCRVLVEQLWLLDGDGGRSFRLADIDDESFTQWVTDYESRPEPDQPPVWSSPRVAVPPETARVARRLMTYAAVGTLCGLLKGHWVEVTHDGNRHFELRVDGDIWTRLTSEGAKTLGVEVRVKKSGAQVGYYQETGARSVWRELVGRWKNGDADIVRRA